MEKEMDPNKRNSYPIQSSDFTPHTSASSQSDTIEEKDDHLPASIRALKNGRAGDDHCRTLIICLDGTGDQFDNDNSNVVHFVSCLKKHEPDRQKTYYQSGIGTYDKGGLKNGFGAAMVRSITDPA